MTNSATIMCTFAAWSSTVTKAAMPYGWRDTANDDPGSMISRSVNLRHIVVSPGKWSQDSA